MLLICTRTLPKNDSEAMWWKEKGFDQYYINALLNNSYSIIINYETNFRPEDKAYASTFYTSPLAPIKAIFLGSYIENF